MREDRRNLVSFQLILLVFSIELTLNYLAILPKQWGVIQNRQFLNLSIVNFSIQIFRNLP